MGQPITLPADAAKVMELYFMEHRARLLDIAAFLDRYDRAAPPPDDTRVEDFRMRGFRQALAVLSDGRPERARRILELFSDPTTTPLETPAPAKGAAGVWPGLGDDAQERRA